MKRKTKKTIIAMGDSFVYGHGCSDRIYHQDEQTGQWVGDPEELSKGPSEFAWSSLLQKDHPDLVDVYNISLPGIDPQSLVSGLANLLDGTKIKPDLIIYNTCPSGRLILRASQRLDDTPFLKKVVNIHDDDKSPNWKIFRQALPVGVSHASNGGHGAFNASQNEAFTKFAGLLYHDALSVQMAVTALLGTYAIANVLGSRFIWAASSYCPAMLNSRGILPKEVMDTLRPMIIPHIFEVQQTDNSKYRAIDGHANEQCHADYYRSVIKPKVAELFR